MTARSHGVLSAIVHASLRHRWIVAVLASLMVAYGLYSLTQAKYDVFPEFAPPQVVVQTEAPGLAPEQVELLVSRPIENALAGVPAIRSLRSSSLLGLSVVIVVFDPASDVYRDRQVVAERLTAVSSQLPAGVQPPAAAPLTSSTGIVLVAGLTSDSLSPMQLRTEAQWTVRPRLLAVPGVANVEIFGGETQEYQAQIRPDRLIRFNLGLADVLAAARRASGVRGAGFVDTPGQRIVLRTEMPAPTARQIAQTVVSAPGGVPVHLGDVADVVAAPAPAIGGAAIMGRPGVELVVTAQYETNTLDVTRAVETAFGGLRPTLAAERITLYPALFRPADFIETATRNIRTSLLIGAVLVFMVLLLFLNSTRTAAISYAAIPVSLLAAVAVMTHLGYTLNTMTLGGLAIAIGVVVDDAVIDVENIVRRLRRNQQEEAPAPAWRVVLDASIEVRGAVVYATFAVILVFVPVLTMSGLAGRLFGPLAVAFILAVLGSLLVALTVTPALSLLLLADRPAAEREAPVTRWTKVRYRRILESVTRRPGPAFVTVGALMLAALAAVPFLGGEFIPQFKEGHFIIHMALAPGSSVDQSLTLGNRVSAELRRLPEVKSVVQQVGRAERGVDIAGTNSSELNVALKPLSGSAAVRAEAEIRRLIAAYPGAIFSMNTFLVERVNETISGATAPVVVKVFGNDLSALDRSASRIAAVLARVPGAREVQLQAPPGAPQLAIRLRPADLVRWGFAPTEVMDAVRTLYEGDMVGQIYDGNRVFDMTAILDPRDRSSVAGVGALPIRNPAGTYVPLHRVADIYETDGRSQVQHDAGRRVVTVTASVVGTNVAGFVHLAQRRLSAEVKLPAGSYLEFSGTAEEQTRAQHDLIVDSIISAIGIALLLSIVTRGWRSLVLVLANVPFALVGGVLAAFLAGGSLSIGSLVGFVTVLGITLRNSIMLVSHYEHLVEVEGRAWDFGTALDGAADRFTPIVMTTLVTGLGLLPLALGMNAPGREIEGPMAVVILGGLATSMVLNLVVLPPLALRYARFAARTGEWE